MENSLSSFDYQTGKPTRIYLVFGDGGTPQAMMPGGPQSQADPTWSPDGNSVAFEGCSPRWMAFTSLI